MKSVLAIYEKSSTGWAVYAPGLAGFVSTGRSRQEVRKLMQEAIEFHPDDLREDHLPIPEPRSEAEVISIPQR